MPESDESLAEKAMPSYVARQLMQKMLEQQYSRILIAQIEGQLGYGE
jgi:hypothetical protein